MTDRTSYAQQNLEQCLAAINRLDGQVQAWEEVFETSARKQAEQVDHASVPGPLKGLILGIKDIFEFAGRPPGNGAHVSPLRMPERDAPLIQQLKEAGAVIAGTLKLTELCFFRPGPTRNPHNPDHTPGGSSSGPAAAVAAGMVPVAVGSQSKGSTIRPASFCGIYGFKPSIGVCSMAGAMNLTYSMEHPGLFARNVDDLSKVFEVLTQPDKRKDPYNRHSVPGICSPGKLRIGVLDVYDHLPLDPEMVTAVTNYAKTLEKEGHRVELVDPPPMYDEVDDIYRELAIPEAYDVLGYIIENGEGDKLGPEIREYIEAGENATLRSYLKAQHKRDEIAYNVEQLFDHHDLIILPAALGPAPAGIHATGDPVCTTITSLTGIPAASVPFGVAKNNLPLGVQVLARKYYDRGLLSALKSLPANLVKPFLFAGPGQR